MLSWRPLCRTRPYLQRQHEGRVRKYSKHASNATSFPEAIRQLDNCVDRSNVAALSTIGAGPHVCMRFGEVGKFLQARCRILGVRCAGLLVTINGPTFLERASTATLGVNNKVSHTPGEICGGCTCAIRSDNGIYPRTPRMPGLSTSGFYRRDIHCFHPQ